MENNRILIFAEDPGAANFIFDLPVYLADQKLKPKLICTGPAVNFLLSRGSKFKEVNNSCELIQSLISINPAIVLIGTSQNPDSIGLKLIEYCRNNNYQTVGFVDMEVDFELRFNGRTNDPLKYAPDFLIVPDEVTKSCFTGIGFKECNIFVSGNPNYDRIIRLKDKFRKKFYDNYKKTMFPKAGEKIIVTLIAEHLNNDDPRMTAGKNYFFKGRGNSFIRTEIFIEEIIDAFQFLKVSPYLVLRLHPKNNHDEYSKYSGEIDEISHSTDPLPLIWNSDIIIGMTSMLVMEAYLLGKKTVSVLASRIEKDWSPHTKYDYVPIVSSRDELRCVLKDIINGKVLYCKNSYIHQGDGNKEITKYIFNRLAYDN